MGALATLYPDDVTNHKAKVKEYFTNRRWDLNKLRRILPEYMVQQISNIEIGHEDQPDHLECYSRWTILQHICMEYNETQKG